jgi:uncharacterized membrane protein
VYSNVEVLMVVGTLVFGLLVVLKEQLMLSECEELWLHAVMCVLVPYCAADRSSTSSRVLAVF